MLTPTPALIEGRPSVREVTPDGIRPAPPRIFRITVRAANGKLARVFAKVPYGGVFAMTEVLTRAITTGELRWAKVEAAPTTAITPHVRETLTRWPEAFELLTERTGVAWNV